MGKNSTGIPNNRHGGKPLWINKHPQIYKLMEKNGLRQYEMAIILGMHPDSLGRKLRMPMSSEETEMIINTVTTYLEEHPDEQRDQ